MLAIVAPLAAAFTSAFASLIYPWGWCALAALVFMGFAWLAAVFFGEELG
jgi:hypothetical protein